MSEPIGYERAHEIIAIGRKLEHMDACVGTLATFLYELNEWVHHEAPLELDAAYWNRRLARHGFAVYGPMPKLPSVDEPLQAPTRQVDLFA